MNDKPTRGELAALALFLLAVMLAMSGCATVSPPYDACEPFCDEPEYATHNAAGGYREACGELPGLLGDDC